MVQETLLTVAKKIDQLLLRSGARVVQGLAAANHALADRGSVSETENRETMQHREAVTKTKRRTRTIERIADPAGCGAGGDLG